MRRPLLPLLLLLLPLLTRAQVFVGPNVGAVFGRSIELGALVYPKNQDWIAASLSAGYTAPGPMYFPRKKAECVADFRNQGWHVRVGLRNGLTTDHHANHFFWGLDLTYSHQNESAVKNTCDNPTGDPFRIDQTVKVWSLGVNTGITWNPLRGKSIYQKFLVDFGLRMSYPFATSVPLIGQRDYISGVGFTWWPIRSIAFQPMAVLRWELFHNRYGYSKGKTRTLFK
jgi:hypothetical protein